MTLPGNIIIRPLAHDEPNHEFAVEAHVETDEAWEGYSRLDPFSGYLEYRKDRYRLVEDQRPQG